MITNTYISSPGVVNTSPTDTTVYLLSSINAVGKELIIRDAAPLTTGRIVVSTTQGLYFSRALSTVQLSSFTITAPYDYITVASRTPQEYMLLQSVQLATRNDNQAFTPNFLQLSTLTANSITTGSNATLGDLVITGSIETVPSAITALNTRTIQATNASTSQLTASTIQAAFTTAADYTTPTLHTLYSAYAANLSTPAAFAVSTDASFNASYLQYGDLKTQGPTSVSGTSFFGSTLTATGNASIYGPAVGFGGTVGVLGSLQTATALSTLGTWSSDGPFYTSNYSASAHTSTTQTYRAGQTYIGTKLGVGTSNNTSYSAYIDGHTYVSADLTTPSISTNTYSTLGISLSSINFITPTQTARVRTDISYVYVNEVPIIGSEITYSSTVTSSNWTSTSYLTTDTVSINRPYPYSAPNPTVAIDIQGGAYISTALIAGNLAIYGGTNANLYTNPTYNTIYLSSSGMLVNNRLFINKENNRVGINTTNPAYTLDVSGLIYHTSSIAYNTGSSTWIIPSDDTLKENVADISANSYTEIFENVKLKTYNYLETTYNVDVSQAVYDVDGNITGYANAVRTYKRGFAADQGIANTSQYGFIAQDLEFYFPNAVYEQPFYGYDDFRFISYDAIMNVNYAMTGMMMSTARHHSTLIGHRTELLSTCTNTQMNMLMDLSANVGAPYNNVNITGSRWIYPRT